VDQLTYVYGAGANGSVNYSYVGTRATETVCDDNDYWVNDPAWYPYVASNFFTEPASPPTMPWHDPAVSTQATIYGRITDGATGEPIDNATFLINGFPAAQADGNGFYILTQLAIGPSGITVPAGAEAPGYDPVVRPAARLEPAAFSEINFALGTWLPGDYDVDADVDLDDYRELAACVTGPDNEPLDIGCDLFDFDFDGDIDLSDHQVFQASFTG
jgi:hypothetical protein